MKKISKIRKYKTTKYINVNNVMNKVDVLI